MLTKQELDNIRAATEPWKGIADVQAPVDVSELLALLDHIAELEENATAQALALKAANERAEANERDAGRYRKLRNGGDGCSVAVVTNPREEFIDDGESWGGIRVNAYDEEIAGDKLDTAIDSM